MVSKKVAGRDIKNIVTVPNWQKLVKQSRYKVLAQAQVPIGTSSPRSLAFGVLAMLKRPRPYSALTYLWVSGILSLE